MTCDNNTSHRNPISLFLIKYSVFHIYENTGSHMTASYLMRQNKQSLLEIFWESIFRDKKRDFVRRNVGAPIPSFLLGILMCGVSAPTTCSHSEAMKDGSREKCRKKMKWYDPDAMANLKSSFSRLPAFIIYIKIHQELC